MCERADEEIRQRLEARSYREALELLMDRYQNKVYRLCCSMLSDETLAEDAAQEVFVRAWKGFPGYKGDASLSTWLYTIARNTCLSSRKSEASRRTLPLTQAAERPVSPAGRRGGPDLDGALARLPEKHRQAVMLFYFNDKSYEEAARMLGLPLGTVKTYLHRAKKELAAALGQGTEVRDGVRGV